MLHHIRWITPRDLPAVERIESSWLTAPAPPPDILDILRTKSCIGMVAEINGRIDGYMVYELFKDHLKLHLFAVSPDARRRGVGTHLLDKLKYKCYSHKRTFIDADVPDSELGAHLFFRYNDFRAVSVFGPTYRFVWDLRDGDREYFEKERAYKRRAK